jgi:hypothetical protein
MNDVLFPAVEAAKPVSVCEHCQKTFEPRAGSGGKPQRFCSEKCRKAFHKAGDVGGDVGDVAGDVEAKEKTPPTADDRPSTGIDYVVDDFTWDSVDVVLEQQKRTCIYWNDRGDLVIRQLASYPDDDPYVVISSNNVSDFVDKLCDFIGIFSAGKP